MPSTFQRDFANPAATSRSEKRRRASSASALNKRQQRKEGKTFSIRRPRDPHGQVAPAMHIPGHWRALGLGLLTALASAALAGFSPGKSNPEESASGSTPSTSSGQLKEARLPNPLQGSVNQSAPNDPGTTDDAPRGSKPDWKQAQLQKGETLARFGQRTELGRQTALKMARATQDVFSARKFRASHTLRFRLNEDGDLQKARYHIDDGKFLAWLPDADGGLHTEIRSYPGTTRVREAYGRIETSLFRAGEKAGLSTQMVMKLAGIFQWDIDFARGLRKGDWFRIVYRERYREGERVGSGPILAAEFHNRDETYTAIRFTDAEGQAEYYQPNGHSIRKAFLRSPVKFNRVTSGFSRKREHPVLGYNRAHEGVDYAAPQGTPIRATGQGRVTHRGREGGYGHVVKLEHANGLYTTVYAHLNRYAGSVQEGTRVKQGDVIGYVGQSGLATGPHLHYEFHVRDQPRNPLKVELPEAEPLPEQHQDTFAQRRHHMLAWLAAIGPTADKRLAAESGRASEPSG